MRVLEGGGLRIIYSDILNKILSLIYPERCLLCGKIILYNQNLCPECRDCCNNKYKIRKILSGDRFESYCISPFLYESRIRKIICDFKFRGRLHYAKRLSQEISRVLNKEFGYIDFDYITCVPISDKKYLSRGYNQSEVLAVNIGKALGVSFYNTLIKSKDNFSQHILNKKDRAVNVKGVYTIIDKKFVYRKRIILCDDIITTGYTLKECSYQLYSSGASNVVCVSAAYS